jgi:hypothetical protein
MPETVYISALQDQFDEGLIAAEEFNARRDQEMEQNDRSGIRERMRAYLVAKYPGPDVDADEFFGQ